MPASDPFFADHPLSARIEAVEAAQLASLVRAVTERLPDRRAASLRVAGGSLAFVAPHLSLSRAAGLGMSGPRSAGSPDRPEARP